MRVNQRLLLRNSLAVIAAGAICASLAACGSTATAAKVPMTDAEIKDFLLQSDSVAMVVDNAGYAAVVAAASAQREALTKARGAEVDSTDITQVKADGEVTLSGLRARIDALAGRTLADEDSRIQAALNKVTAALKGSDKKAITDALASLNETVTSVEKAVSQRDNPGSGDGTGSGTTVEEPRDDTETGGNGNSRGGQAGGGNAGAGTDTGGDNSNRAPNGGQVAPGGGQQAPGGGNNQGNSPLEPGGQPPAEPAPNQPGGGGDGEPPAQQNPGGNHPPVAPPNPGGDQGGGGDVGGGPAVPNPQPGDGDAPQQP
ncbi:hypothetical protein [Actinomyces weissii]|uniref:Uncharacterized protein n=1 Tax=Actinomyces weissii TaxID=675090 RepID=A0A7T7MAH1_9ACTO|nr:hypothetical protein [Actinomyces weissii]QQM67925.1 hypothetical protein JG540_03425 [Actinomyces weissii]